MHVLSTESRGNDSGYTYAHKLSLAFSWSVLAHHIHVDGDNDNVGASERVPSRNVLVFRLQTIVAAFVHERASESRL